MDQQYNEGTTREDPIAFRSRLRNHRTHNAHLERERADWRNADIENQVRRNVYRASAGLHRVTIIAILHRLLEIQPRLIHLFFRKFLSAFHTGVDLLSLEVVKALMDAGEVDHSINTSVEGECPPLGGEVAENGLEGMFLIPTKKLLIQTPAGTGP